MKSWHTRMIAFILLGSLKLRATSFYAEQINGVIYVGGDTLIVGGDMSTHNCKMFVGPTYIVAIAGLEGIFRLADKQPANKKLHTYIWDFDLQRRVNQIIENKYSAQNTLQKILIAENAAEMRNDNILRQQHGHPVAVAETLIYMTSFENGKPREKLIQVSSRIHENKRIFNSKVLADGEMLDSSLRGIGMATAIQYPGHPSKNTIREYPSTSILKMLEMDAITHKGAVGAPFTLYRMSRFGGGWIKDDSHLCQANTHR